MKIIKLHIIIFAVITMVAPAYVDSISIRSTSFINIPRPYRKFAKFAIDEEVQKINKNFYRRIYSLTPLH